MKGVNKLAIFLLVGILSVSSVYSTDVQKSLSTLDPSKENEDEMLLLDEELFSKASESRNPGMLSEAMKRVGASLKTVAPQFFSTVAHHQKTLSLITLLLLPAVSQAVKVHNSLPVGIQLLTFNEHELTDIGNHKVGGWYDPLDLGLITVSLKPGEVVDLGNVSQIFIEHLFWMHR